MSKKRKPSERLIKCYYCSEEFQVKSLERHTLRAHGDPKVFPPLKKDEASKALSIDTFLKNDTSKAHFLTK